MMKQRSIWTMICSVGVLLAFVASLSFAGIPEKDKGATLEKTTSNDIYHPFTINNVYNYYSNNGDGSFNKFSADNEGFEFYKGDGKHIIFEDGVVWGGFHKGFADPKVGGSVYRHALQAGRLLTYGTATSDPKADDASLPGYRVYRVRPDMNPNTVDQADGEAKLAADEVPYITRDEPSVTATSLWNDYVKDWNEWPADQGAPFTYGIQVSADGKDTTFRKAPMPYDPKYDIPGVKGADQTLWYVANDMNAPRVSNLAGCPPIGLEMQRTIWGYKRAGALGNTIFASSILINKSGAKIDSMFMVQWADPDLGDAGDDFVGCDTSRSLGYVYNGGNVDKTYGTAVPAGGFDFFQGPLVPSATDSAVFKLRYRKGFKNLPMSAFVMFTQGNTTYADPRQGNGGNIDWYRLMNGTIASTGTAFFDPIAKTNTKFVFPGDPAKATDGSAGWVDGIPGGGLAPQDRRMCLVTGPFTMAPGDTQELVVANLAGVGGDRLSSVSALRSVDDKAQAAYNNLFVLPAPPPAPQVTVTPLDGGVVLTWANPAGVAKTEGSVDQGFGFEGYKVYELAQPSFKDPILLGTFDLNNGVKAISDTIHDPASGLDIPTVIQMGTDNGIVRSIKLTSSKVTGTQMVNFSKYYFAVTAYSYNANPPAAAGTHALESPAQVLTVIPQTAGPGTRYGGAVGDSIGVAHAKGASDGAVIARVVSPQALTGGNYSVFFQTVGDEPTWGVARTLAGKTDTLTKGQTDQTGSLSTAIVLDGMQIAVQGAPNDFKFFEVVTNKNGPITPPQQGCFPFNASGFPLLGGSDRPDGTKQQSAGLTASQGWGIHTGMNSPSMDYHYDFFVSRVTQGGARWPVIVPFDFEMRFTAAGGKALIPSAFTGVKDTIIDVPFELWNIGMNTPNDKSDDYRLFPYVLDVDNSFSFNLLTKAGTDSVDNGGGGATHSISGGANDPFTDWVYWVRPTNRAPGQAGYNEILAGAQAAIAGGQDPYLGAGTAGDVLRRMVLVGWNFGTVASGTYAEQMPETGTVFRIISTKPNTSLDQFTFTAPANTNADPNLAKLDAQNVNVFPNPYLGFNPQEINKYGRFVTFTHLPRKVTIRIFNLAGILVRTLMKDDAGQTFQWDLNNEKAFPVSAGMYIAFIDMPDIGMTKTLKLGVIPEQQYLDRW